MVTWIKSCSLTGLKTFYFFMLTLNVTTSLILDCDGSHLTYPIVLRATEENISIVFLPPRKTNALQPLDVADAVKLFKYNW